MGEVAPIAREEIVEGDDLVTLGEEAIAEMRAKEAGSAGDEAAFGHGIAWWDTRRTRRGQCSIVGVEQKLTRTRKAGRTCLKGSASWRIRHGIGMRRQFR